MTSRLCSARVCSTRRDCSSASCESLLSASAAFLSDSSIWLLRFSTHTRDHGEAELAEQDKHDDEDERHPYQEAEIRVRSDISLLCDESDYYGEQADTLDEGGDNDCVHQELAHVLRLACTRLKHRLSYLAYSYTCAHGCKSGTDCRTELSEGKSRGRRL